MEKKISITRHLNLINKMIFVRDKDVSKILKANDIHSINNRIDCLKSKYLSMLDMNLFKIRPIVKKVGEIEFGRYRIEKLVMESIEGYFVPMNLYISNKNIDKKRPAVLVNVGHYLEGKALPENQIICVNLAMQGFVALIFDPICQGERDLFPDYFDERWKKDLWVVEQHMRIGNQCFLLGYNSINYFLNDAIKAIDYLITRNDVDADRIGTTGQSGGGTLTYLLAALDSRIKAAVPIHCISTMDRICANGIGDSEQSMINMVSEGFDIVDFLWLIAPRMLFISAGIRDFFSIEGVRDIYNELKSLYKILGCEHNVDLCEIDTRHEIDCDVRKSVYNYFGRAFLGTTGYREEHITILSQEQLSCGYTALDSRTPIDYNKMMCEAIKQQRSSKIQKQSEIKTVLLNMLNINCRKYEVYREKVFMSEGKYHWHLVFTSDDTLFFEVDIKHNGNQGDLYIYIDVESSVCINDKLMDDLSNAIVIRPFGSSSDSCKKKTEYDEETKLAYQGIIIGESILELRLSQVLYLIDFIKEEGINRKIMLEGKRQGGLLALLACVVDDRISKAYCKELVSSFDKLFGCRNCAVNETDIIPGFLKELDIDILLHGFKDKIIIAS